MLHSSTAARLPSPRPHTCCCGLLGSWQAAFARALTRRLGRGHAVLPAAQGMLSLCSCSHAGGQQGSLAG